MLCSGQGMCYASLLQCKLTVKTQEACSVEYSQSVYDKVKSAILCVYELVPEVYTWCFCNLKKTLDHYKITGLLDR